MAAALKELSCVGYAVYPEDVARLSPLIHRHLNCQGRHAFVLPEAVAPRPIATPARPPTGTVAGLNTVFCSITTQGPSPTMPAQLADAAFNERRVLSRKRLQGLICGRVFRYAPSHHHAAELARLRLATRDDHAALVAPRVGWMRTSCSVGRGIKAGQPLGLLLDRHTALPIVSPGRVRPDGETGSRHCGHDHVLPFVSGWLHGLCEFLTKVAGRRCQGCVNR